MTQQQSEGRRRRTRSGCLECRRKRRKCDETKPACIRCTKAKHHCTWASRVAFRTPATLGDNVQIKRPEQANSQPGPPRHFEILDMTESVIRDCEDKYTGSGDESDNNVDPLTTDHRSHAGSRSRRRHSKATSSNSSSVVREAGLDDSPDTTRRSSTSQTTPASCYSPGRAVQSTALEHQNDSETATSGETCLWDHGTPSSQQRTDAAANLLYLRQTQPTHLSFEAASMTDDGQGGTAVSLDMHFTPDDTPFTYDDLFASGTTYYQLQSTLRHHLFQESGSVAPSRACTPEPCDGELSRQLELDDDPSLHHLSIHHLAEDSESSFLTQEQECQLWRTWVEEVSPWLDKFDRDKHFLNTLPILAKSHSHLKYAILAVSARQLERKQDPNGSLSHSLVLYQQAIHDLLPCLGSRSTSVIASCVVLCVLEMLSCSPKAWERHLDGCATLLQAVAINGFSGGVEQALFWCFARMDVCGGLITSSKTLIPVSSWTPAPDLESAVQLFRTSSSSYECQANQAIFLTAHVVQLLSSVQTLPANTSVFISTEQSDAEFCEKWKQLWRFLDEWYLLRPPEMHPVYSSNENETPFPTLLYSSPSAISGNQMYHTATLLMLQHKPPQVALRPKPRSILWHGRQIVGISASNHNHGSWTNSLQPLWIAGRLFSSAEEHAFILELLGRIERETGWATRWRAEDLREWWGDLGE